MDVDDESKNDVAVTGASNGTSTKSSPVSTTTSNSGINKDIINQGNNTTSMNIDITSKNDNNNSNNNSNNDNNNRKLSILAAKSTAAPMASPNITTAGSTKNTSSPRASSSVYDYKRLASSNSGVSNHEAQIKHAAQKLMSKDATVEVLRKIEH